MRIFDRLVMPNSGMSYFASTFGYADPGGPDSRWWDAFAPTHRVLIVALAASALSMAAAWALAV